MKTNLNKTYVNVIAKKLAAGTALLAASALVLAGCSNAAGSSSQSSQESAQGGAASGKALNVYTSFYPIQWLAEQVGGDAVKVTSVTPSNAEPHDFELAPADVDALSKADVLFYVSGFQPSLDDAIANLSAVNAVNLKDEVDLVAMADDVASAEAAHGHDHSDHDHDDHDDHDHDDDNDTGHDDHDHAHEGALDPHFWLDPERMEGAADAVAEALAAADPSRKAQFEANEEALSKKLDQLDDSYEKGLAQCKRNHLVTAHAAFGYLTGSYGLIQSAITGVDPEAEPSPAELAAVKKVVQETGTTTIFTEELVSPDVAEALAAETGAQTAVLSPLESAPTEGDYLTAMEANLKAIQSALECA
ncbi:MAG: metal ABC transporter substrate-binding protein [Actinomycetaceae bacterium]|nr:metal ABC transporter substrate-binding protein [Arcanobacterium sp.]MDD7504482.1 metal ABC transporter substrate-binding protein [Actinomycetaceae bacterium]MDY6142848.1 metal ABC transporter substrate-binding protein [Arcanobacterium sp.]